MWCEFVVLIISLGVMIVFGNSLCIVLLINWYDVDCVGDIGDVLLEFGSWVSLNLFLGVVVLVVFFMCVVMEVMVLLGSRWKFIVVLVWLGSMLFLLLVCMMVSVVVVCSMVLELFDVFSCFCISGLNSYRLDSVMWLKFCILGVSVVNIFCVILWMLVGNWLLFSCLSVVFIMVMVFCLCGGGIDECFGVVLILSCMERKFFFVMLISVVGLVSFGSMFLVISSFLLIMKLRCLLCDLSSVVICLVLCLLFIFLLVLKVRWMVWCGLKLLVVSSLMVFICEIRLFLLFYVLWF